MTPRNPEGRIYLEDEEIIVDSFAGGGGASRGIEIALGRSPDIAINHDAEAIAMHRANHPSTEHFNESIFHVDPVSACKGRPVGLAWFSPDCTHFSKARGGKPVDKEIRGLAWIVLRWMVLKRPRIAGLENVEEFQTWGPIYPADHPKKKLRNQPIPEHSGSYFKAFIDAMTTGVDPAHPALDEIIELLGPDFPIERLVEGLGYDVQWKELRGCDFGAPTTRKRLFLVARCDGQPIVWPTPTHGPDRSHPHRTFAECADFSLPCPSIFMNRRQARRFFKETGIRVQRPLALPTQRRIARGVFRLVINDAEPFIVGVGGRMGQTLERSVHQPSQTITGKSDAAIVVPYLAHTAHGEQDKNGKRRGPRSLNLHAPLGTIVPASKHALVAAFLAKHNGGHEATGQRLGEPAPAIVGKVNQAIVASHLLKLHGSSVQGDLFDKPAPTIRSGGNHLAEVRAFLIQYYSSGSGKEPRAVGEPLPAITARDRFALVTVKGIDYVIIDIGMRMVTTRERFLAQGFGPEYIIDPPFTYEYRWKKGPKKGQLIRRVTKPLTEEAQGRMCGNSVCPPLAAAIVGANCPELVRQERVA